VNTKTGILALRREISRVASRQHSQPANRAYLPLLIGPERVAEPISLVITATAAPGNLLGNLLCAVAHLLDSNGSLTSLVTLLNQILAAL
jgi:hypothetical protein